MNGVRFPNALDTLDEAVRLAACAKKEGGEFGEHKVFL
jgi:hypothetical protein